MHMQGTFYRLQGTFYQMQGTLYQIEGIAYHCQSNAGDFQRNLHTGCPIRNYIYDIYKGTLLLQKMSDFKNFFTGMSAMN